MKSKVSDSDIESLTSIASQLLQILAAQRGEEFSRTVTVSDEVGGFIHVSPNSVAVHPYFLTQGHGGDVVACARHILDSCREFDIRREADTRRALLSLRETTESMMRQLFRHDPAALSEIYTAITGREP